MPDKMSLREGVLTVTSVCRDCPDGSPRASDLMVLQCNASNVHGYVLGSAYLNVLSQSAVTVVYKCMLLVVKAFVKLLKIL